MPIYDFVCTKKKCKKEFQKICSFKEDLNTVKCPACNGKVKKVFDIETLRIHISGTTSKMDNFEYAAKKNMNKAQNESSRAREEAAKQGINTYNNLPDFTDNGNRMNFID